MRSVSVTLIAALALMTIAIAAVLARSPLAVVGTNSIPAKVNEQIRTGGISSCQPGGTLPRGTSAIRIALEPTSIGPTVSVKVLSGSRLLAEGQQVAGWGSASTLTIHVKPLAHAIDGARICTAVGPTVLPFNVSGIYKQPSGVAANKLQNVIVRMEYLRPGPKSWWSLASSVAYHMGLGRAGSGTWIAFLALALMLAVAALASHLTLRELR